MRRLTVFLLIATFTLAGQSLLGVATDLLYTYDAADRVMQKNFPQSKYQLDNHLIP